MRNKIGVLRNFPVRPGLISSKEDQTRNTTRNLLVPTHLPCESTEKNSSATEISYFALKVLNKQPQSGNALENS